MDDRYPLALHGLEQSVGLDGTRMFWVHSTDQHPQLLNALPDFAAPTLQDGQSLLKAARQRFIFRDDQGPTACVFKLFPLSFIGSKLRHQKYAYREFANMRRAHERALPVPRLIAFLEKRRMGLVECSGLIQESLDGSADLLWHYKDGLGYDRIADVATQVLKAFYDAGANHIDLRDENIMLDTDRNVRHVIDWQYAAWVPPRAAWLLEYLVAYFIAQAPAGERDMLLRDWVPAVHGACQHAVALDSFSKRVIALIEAKPRVKQRLVLTPISEAV